MDGNTTPLRLPARVSPGDKITAKAWNEMVSALDTLNRRVFRYPKRVGSNFDPPPFYLYGYSIATTNGVKVHPGWVVEKVPLEGSLHNTWMPVVNGVPLNATTVPTLEFASGDYIYCKVLTDTYGTITTAPEIIADSADKTSQHYIPAAPLTVDGTGLIGEHWFKIAMITVASSRPVQTIYQQSDIEWERYVWRGYNTLSTTTAGLVYQKYEKNQGYHQFRAITAATGTPVSLSSLSDSEPQAQLRTENDYVKIGGNGVNLDIFFKTLNGTYTGCLLVRDGYTVFATTSAGSKPGLPGSLSSSTEVEIITDHGA